MHSFRQAVLGQSWMGSGPTPVGYKRSVVAAKYIDLAVDRGNARWSVLASTLAYLRLFFFNSG
jgi:hypothetical protein